MSESKKVAEKKETTEEPFVLKNEIFSYIKMFIFIFIIVALLNIFVVRISTVRGSSMEPTLSNNDRLITTPLVKSFKRGDIVAINRHDDHSLVKRIIAVEGDTIDIDFDTGEVFINDNVIEEPYIADITKEKLSFEGPVTVPKEHVFVMGDNRNNSDDSRNVAIGMIDIHSIYGKVIIRVYPFRKFD